MQPTGRHFRADQREADPVVVRAMKSPMVFQPQMNNQRPNSSKLVTIPPGKPSNSIYQNNSRFPSPALFSTKVVSHEPGAGVSAFSAVSVPPGRSSAFNRVTGIPTPPMGRRNMVMKEEQLEKGQIRAVWQPSSNEQVYRMAQITSQQPANGASNSIIQIPQSLHNHLYLEQQNLATQFYPYHQPSPASVPVVPMNYLASVLNQTQRPSILRKLSKPADDQKDSMISSSYSHSDITSYAGRGSAVKHVKIKAPSSANNDPYFFTDSPRKKPRKQAVVAHEDVFASNVPHTQSLGPSAGPGCVGTVPQPGMVKQEEGEDTMSFYPPRKRMSLLTPSSGCPGRLNNHFTRHSDIKVRRRKSREPIPDISTIASHGWRLLHLKSQLDSASTVQKETKSKLCEYKDYFSNISLELEDKGNCESVADLLQTINHACQSNVTQLKSAMTSLDKLMNGHKPRILDLVKEHKGRSGTPAAAHAMKTPPYSTPTYSTPTYSTPTLRRAPAEPGPSSSTKRTNRKRKT